jgi:hypothetical protein
MQSSSKINNSSIYKLKCMVDTKNLFQNNKTIIKLKIIKLLAKKNRKNRPGIY